MSRRIAVSPPKERLFSRAISPPAQYRSTPVSSKAAGIFEIKTPTPKSSKLTTVFTTTSKIGKGDFFEKEKKEHTQKESDKTEDTINVSPPVPYTFKPSRVPHQVIGGVHHYHYSQPPESALTVKTGRKRPDFGKLTEIQSKELRSKYIQKFIELQRKAPEWGITIPTENHTIEYVYDMLTSYNEEFAIQSSMRYWKFFIGLFLTITEIVLVRRYELFRGFAKRQIDNLSLYDDILREIVRKWVDTGNGKGGGMSPETKMIMFGGLQFLLFVGKSLATRFNVPEFIVESLTNQLNQKLGKSSAPKIIIKSPDYKSDSESESDEEESGDMFGNIMGMVGKLAGNPSDLADKAASFLSPAKKVETSSPTVSPPPKSSPRKSPSPSRKPKLV